MSSDLLKLQKELEPERTQTEAKLDWLRNAFQIVDAASYEVAADLVKAAKARWKELEAKREELTKPLLEVKRGIDALFKDAQKPLAEAEAILKAKIGAYDRTLAASRAAAMHQAAAIHQAGGIPTLAIPEPVRAAGVASKQVWTVQVADAALVPVAYCSPDLAKLRAVVQGLDPSAQPPAIPGVLFTLEDRVTVRAGKA